MYSACVISALINDWSAIDKEKTVQYILSCQTFDHGFAMHPFGEAHCGVTYCAVAALALMGRLDAINKDEVIEFIVGKQGFGFHVLIF